MNNAIKSYTLGIVIWGSGALHSFQEQTVVCSYLFLRRYPFALFLRILLYYICMALLQQSRRAYRQAGLHLVVDIGTALISGMIWREHMGAFAKNKKPDILEVVRVPLAGKVRHSFIPALRVFFQKTEKALGGRDPATITIGLAAPYYQGKTVWVETSFAKPTPVSAAMIAKLCEEKIIAERQTCSEGEEPFNHNVLAVFLNGYHAGHNLEGRLATHLEIAIRFSAWRSALKKQLHDLLEERFPLASIRVNTFPNAYGELFRQMPHFTREAAVIDIGGSITECSFFNEGVLEEVFTIPRGADFWLSQIAEHEHMSRDEVISWISGGSKRFDQLLTPHLVEWNTLLRPVVAAKMLTQPARHFFLVGGGALLPQTSASFSSFLQTFQFGGHADAHALSVETFRDCFGAWPSSLLSFLDVSLIALALRLQK